MIREREGLALPGGLMFLVVLAAIGSDVWLFQSSAAGGPTPANPVSRARPGSELVRRILAPVGSVIS